MLTCIAKRKQINKQITHIFSKYSKTFMKFQKSNSKSLTLAIFGLKLDIITCNLIFAFFILEHFGPFLRKNNQFFLEVFFYNYFQNVDEIWWRIANINQEINHVGWVWSNTRYHYPQFDTNIVFFAISGKNQQFKKVEVIYAVR